MPKKLSPKEAEKLRRRKEARTKRELPLPYEDEDAEPVT